MRRRRTRTCVQRYILPEYLVPSSAIRLLDADLGLLLRGPLEEGPRDVERRVHLGLGQDGLEAGEVEEAKVEASPAQNDSIQVGCEHEGGAECSYRWTAAAHCCLSSSEEGSRNGERSTIGSERSLIAAFQMTSVGVGEGRDRKSVV